MTLNCEMIEDLLPLYADDVCSPESREAVENHLKSCKNCRSNLDLLLESIDAVLPEHKEADVIKAAGKAWKKSMRKALLNGSIITLILISLFIGILTYLRSPVVISPKALSSSGIFQHRVFRWGLSDQAVRLLWRKPLRVDDAASANGDSYKYLLSHHSCTFNGALGDMIFFFDDEGLFISEILFQSNADDTWAAQVLDELRQCYGPETRTVSKEGIIAAYYWELGDSCLQFSPGTLSKPCLYLYKYTP